jgi:DNA-binding NarL/FixJ family response regulator
MSITQPKAESKVSRILIVDDHPIVREGLAMHLAAQTDLEISGQADDLPSALALLSSNRFDLAIIDISLKNSNGLDLVRLIKERYETVRVLVWSMYPEHVYAERALRAGAQGYLHKGQASHHVLSAVRDVLQGKMYVSGAMAEQLLRRVVGRNAEDRSPIDTLSDREFEAFRLIGEGMTTHSIAQRMHVSPKTVETYRARIREKLGLCNTTELIQRAAQWMVETK